MKNTETQNLESALCKYSSLQSEIEDIRRRSADSTTRLAALETSCDLDDAGALGEIGRLQTACVLLPNRLSAKERALTETEAAILKICQEFIATTLIPKLRSLRQKTEAKTKTELQPFFPDTTTLDAAISSSALISSLNALDYIATITANPFDGVLGYAQRTLEAWEQAKNFEAKIS